MANLLLDAYYSLSKNINKVNGKLSNETDDGVVSPLYPELTLNITNEELVKLTQKWEKAWNDSEVFSNWQKKSTENENYWLGKHFVKPEIDKTRALVDNVIFEALESYLPQVIHANPDAMVALKDQNDQDQGHLAFVDTLQDQLGDIADELNFRLKLKKASRFWAIHLVGVAKLGWDLTRDIPTVKIIRAAKMIFDPDSTVDEDGYSGNFLGEHRKLQASVLIKILEEVDAETGAVDAIKKLVKENLDTEVGFKEFWTNDYMCWVMENTVLLKKKNPHWNYEQQVPDTAVDDFGTETPTTKTIPGVNHLPSPKIPYVLLSVFNLGTQPIDDTSLIGQNLANQDVINKRAKQIDKNADNTNNGIVVSGEKSSLSKEQSKGVAAALQKGGVVYVPSGSATEAVARISAPSLSPDVYDQLQDIRQRTREIFGTQGSSPAGVQSESTVRGKIQVESLDTSRIGGGFTEYLEQFADDIYNYFVQLLYVYDTTYRMLPNKPKITVTIKEGSLLPKDKTTLANQATSLASAGKMSTLDMFKALDYANAEEMAANVWLEANAPSILFADDTRVQQAIQMQQQAAQQQAAAAAQPAANAPKPPSESINFKDLPPDGKVQLAAKAGLTLHPEGVAAHEQLVSDRSKPPTQPIINQ